MGKKPTRKQKELLKNIISILTTGWYLKIRRANCILCIEIPAVSG